MPIVIAVLGILLIVGYCGEQWIHPRLVMSQTIDTFKGSLYSVNSTDYKLINLDSAFNSSNQGSVGISMVYKTELQGKNQEIQVDEMNLPQQKSDIQYNVGAPENDYMDCLKGSVLVRGVACQQIGKYKGNPIFYVPVDPDGVTAYAFVSMNQTLIVLADYSSVTYSGINTYITKNEATSMIFSLKPVSKSWRTNTLIFHYNGGVLTHSLPGNSVQPLPL
jgi:hypothetical protein